MMKNESTVDKEKLEHARELVKQLESGNKENADQVLGKLATFHESNMYHEMGKLTRELHTTLSDFQIDTNVIGLAEHDLPDAKDRLNYVIVLTEQAANKTLTAVEETIPICDALGKKANGINEEWRRFVSKDLAVNEFRTLVREMSPYLESIVDESSRIKANLNDVLMAQGFQDLTGQSIRRVITLVQEVEQTLINFIRMTGRKNEPDSSVQKQQKSGLEGPQVPGKEGANVMKCQDDVDDLLSSLGF